MSDTTDLTETTVVCLPDCDICKERVAEYDFRTASGSPYRGSWGYGCGSCYIAHRASGTLGAGNGQRLILAAS